MLLLQERHLICLCLPFPFLIITEFLLVFRMLLASHLSLQQQGQQQQQQQQEQQQLQQPAATGGVFFGFMSPLDDINSKTSS